MILRLSKRAQKHTVAMEAALNVQGLSRKRLEQLLKVSVLRQCYMVGTSYATIRYNLMPLSQAFVVSHIMAYMR